MSKAGRTVHPVNTNDAFRWLLSGSGFWLCLSPFLLFNSDRLIAGEVNTEAVTVMCFGIFALVLAGMIHGHHQMVQTTTAILFATGLGASPWLIGYVSHATATINACATSGLILMMSIHQAIRMHVLPKPHPSQYRKKVHRLHPLTFI